MRGKDRKPRDKTGYLYRGLLKRFEKQKEELDNLKEIKPEPEKPRSEMTIEELLKDNEKYVRKRKTDIQEEIINNDGKETEKDSEVC